MWGKRKLHSAENLLKLIRLFKKKPEEFSYLEGRDLSFYPVFDIEITYN